MSLLAVRQAIVDTLQAALPQGVTVAPHGGRFDSAAEIQRWGAKAPAVLVACVRTSVRDIASGVVMLDAHFVLFVLTRDMPPLTRDAGALALVQSVLPVIQGNTWGVDDTDAPVGIDARNLYSGAIDKLGVALWAITFMQTITDPAIDQVTLDALHPFETFHQDIDMAPADRQIDITQTDTLPQ